MLPNADFGRIAAQTAKQVIIQRIREAEREKQFNEFKDKNGANFKWFSKKIRI